MQLCKLVGSSTNPLGYLTQQWERQWGWYNHSKRWYLACSVHKLLPLFPHLLLSLPFLRTKGFVKFKLLPCIFVGFFLALQAPKNWCVCFGLVVRSDGSALSWEIPEDRNAQLARHSQIWHHLPVLLGGLHCSSGNAEINGPSEIPAPKVRARAVTLGEGGKKPCELFATGASVSSSYFPSFCFFFN